MTIKVKEIKLAIFELPTSGFNKNAYMLHMTASTLVFLTTAEKELEKDA